MAEGSASLIDYRAREMATKALARLDAVNLVLEERDKADARRWDEARRLLSDVQSTYREGFMSMRTAMENHRKDFEAEMIRLADATTKSFTDVRNAADECETDTNRKIDGIKGRIQTATVGLVGFLATCVLGLIGVIWTMLPHAHP